MTTSGTPLAALRAQADTIAAGLKSMERGTAHDPDGKIAIARAKATITFGIVQDDKVIKVTIDWERIRTSDEAGIAEWIVGYMSGESKAVH